MEYKLLEIKTGNALINGVIKYEDNGIVLSIPFDEANTDYQAYLSWLAEGNTPLPPDDPPPAPPEQTIDEKLASVGLTIDDLKTALGLN